MKLLLTLHAEICSEKCRLALKYVFFVMCMDITETYHDMIGLWLLLFMRKAEKTHLGDRVEIRGL